jgi:hypothetical protein
MLQETQSALELDEFKEEARLLVELRSDVHVADLKTTLAKFLEDVADWLMSGVPITKDTQVQAALQLLVDGHLVTSQESMEVTGPWRRSHLKLLMDERIQAVAKLADIRERWGENANWVAALQKRLAEAAVEYESESANAREVTALKERFDKAMAEADVEDKLLWEKADRLLQQQQPVGPAPHEEEEAEAGGSGSGAELRPVRICDQCGCEGEGLALLLCGGCLTRRYCAEGPCQSTAWRGGHRKECLELQKLRQVSECARVGACIFTVATEDTA